MCGKGNVDVKNLGFVNSDWLYKGILKSTLSNVQGEGKTFDEKLHTFKEADLYSLFISLEVAVSMRQPPTKVIDYQCYSSQINETEYEDEEEKRYIEDDVDDNVEEFSIQTNRNKTRNLNNCGKNVVRNSKYF